MNDLKKKENLSLVSKIACLLGAVGWIGYISYAYTYINPIIALKASELNNTTITVGEMADEFFDNPKWKVRGKRTIASTCSYASFSAIIVSHDTESKKLST